MNYKQSKNLIRNINYIMENDKSVTTKIKDKAVSAAANAKDAVYNSVAKAAAYVDRTVKKVTDPATSRAYKYKQNNNR